VCVCVWERDRDRDRDRERQRVMISSSKSVGGDDYELSLSIYIGRDRLSGKNGGFALMIPGFRKSCWKVYLHCWIKISIKRSLIIHLAISISFEFNILQH
jgi:hypothetical protein